MNKNDPKYQTLPYNTKFHQNLNQFTHYHQQHQQQQVNPISRTILNKCDELEEQFSSFDCNSRKNNNSISSEGDRKQSESETSSSSSSSSSILSRNIQKNPSDIVSLLINTNAGLKHSNDINQHHHQHHHHQSNKHHENLEQRPSPSGSSGSSDRISSSLTTYSYTNNGKSNFEFENKFNNVVDDDDGGGDLLNSDREKLREKNDSYRFISDSISLKTSAITLSTTTATVTKSKMSMLNQINLSNGCRLNDFDHNHQRDHLRQTKLNNAGPSVTINPIESEISLGFVPNLNRFHCSKNIQTIDGDRIGEENDLKNNIENNQQQRQQQVERNQRSNKNTSLVSKT